MKQIILIGILVLLVGCATPEPVIEYRDKIVYVNNTREILKVVTTECPDCICKDQVTIEKTEPTDCSKKLNLCNIRLDTLNDQLFDCLIGNNSEYREDLQFNLSDCQLELNQTNEKLDKIKEVLN